MELAVVATDIQKRYGKVEALRGVSFAVRKGELFGLIGPDGAGKTSLFRILATLLTADAGQATVCGLDVVRDYQAIRSKIGYMPGRFSLYQDLTVEENLELFATVFPPLSVPITNWCATFTARLSLSASGVPEPCRAG